MAEGANIVNKMSLYDLLTLIIPGSMVVAVLYVGAFPWIKAFSFSWIVSLAIFGAMYFIGLLLKNWSLQKDSSIFDKNIEEIQTEYSKFAEYTNHKMGRKKMTYDDYCADYYYAVSHYSKTKVPILEAQIAFLRTMQYSMIVLFYISMTFFVINVGHQCMVVRILWFGGTVLTCGFATSDYFIKLAHAIQKKVYEGVIYDSYYHGGPILKRINPREQ